MKTGLASAILLFVAGVAACGGKVIWVEDGGPNGGSGGTSTSSKTTSSKVSSTAQVGTSVVGTSVVATSVSNDVSVGDVMPLCDTGQFGDFGTMVCDECVNCAISSLCVNEANAFQSDPDGQAFNDCLSNCNGGGPPNCFQQCQNQHPQGAMLYFALLECVVCNACPNNCNAQQNCMFGGSGGGPGGSGMGNGPGGGPGGAG
jgi:hypothetical protein